MYVRHPDASESDMRTIPEITDERVHELLGRIKPLILTSEGMREIKPVCPWTKSFIWHPELVGEVVVGLELIRKVETYHNYAFYGLFKPDLSEVMAQVDGLPELDEVAYFWLDSSRMWEHPFLHKPDEHNINGYHRADVHLFRRI